MTTPADKQLAVLEKLAELEESVSRLYGIYAERFPDYRQFWSGLVNEEQQHAAWVRDLQSLLVKGAAGFAENRFNTFAIQAFINYLQDEAERAADRSLINAFSIAAYIEDSLMERHYFEIVQGDSAELKQTLNDLAEATRGHVKKIKDTLETYRKTAGQD